MKKIFEGIKDILYDSIDYIIIIGIIGVVVLVISWRLDLLFANDAMDLPPEHNVIVDNTQEPKGEDEDFNNPDDIVDDNNDSSDSSEDNNHIEEPLKDTIVQISIPEGSLPSRIGSILEESGLISSSADFIEKSQEMKLDTKLRSGEYEIQTGSSMEEIVKIISRQQ